MHATLPDTLHAADGTPLALRHWHPDVPALGTVCIVHGLGEHGGRYPHVAQALTGAGWRVVAHDHRGHGRSGGPRGRLHADDDLLTDLALVVDSVREAASGPVVLLGHSMGGLVAATFVAGRQRTVDGLVLSSPALDIGLGATRRALLAAADTIAPNLGLPNGLPPEGISRDPAVVQAYKDDPLVHDRISPRLAQFMVEASSFVFERAASWTVPTLLMFAGADKLVRPAGSVQFADRVPSSVLTRQRFKGWAHEIFNEPEGQQPIQMLVQWLSEHFPAQADDAVQAA